MKTILLSIALLLTGCAPSKSPVIWQCGPVVLYRANEAWIDQQITKVCAELKLDRKSFETQIWLPSYGPLVNEQTGKECWSQARKLTNKATGQIVGLYFIARTDAPDWALRQDLKHVKKIA